MNLQDLKNRILGKFNGEGEQARRADGGTSCYRPNRRRTREEQNASDNAIPYVHTGFTGMNPPQDYTGMVPEYETARNNPGYNGWGPTAPQDYSRGYNQGYSNEERAAYRDNISYMPGSNQPAENSNRVARVMTLTGLKNCYDAIECMKNGEILILTMDAIANEGEITRCQDMLAGAAFTLGCKVRSLPAPRMVMVVPASVSVLPEERSQPVNAMPYYQAPQAAPQPMQEAAQPAPRQRRSAQNTQAWKSFAAEQQDAYRTGYMQTEQPRSEYTGYAGYGF